MRFDTAICVGDEKNVGSLEFQTTEYGHTRYTGSLYDRALGVARKAFIDYLRENDGKPMEELV